MYFDGLTIQEARKLRNLSLFYRRATSPAGRVTVAAQLPRHFDEITLAKVISQQNGRGFPVAVVGAYCRLLAAVA